MAQTTNQMIELFERQSARSNKGLSAAVVSSNYQLAAVNCRQGVKARLMRALIQWKNGDSPHDLLRETMSFHCDAIDAMKRINGNAKLTDSSIERVGFCAYLVDANWTPFDLDGFESDRLLDGVLANQLFDRFDKTCWERGMTSLRDCGSSLAIATYSCYFELIHSLPQERPAIVAKLEDLFAERKTDSFFSGGDQTEGGGADNDVVVDYRLGALAKQVGVQWESRHCWR